MASVIHGAVKFLVIPPGITRTACFDIQETKANCGFYFYIMAENTCKAVGTVLDSVVMDASAGPTGFGTLVTGGYSGIKAAVEGDAVKATEAAGGIWGGLSGGVAGFGLGGPVGAVIGSAVGGLAAGKAAGAVVALGQNGTQNEK